MSTTPVDHQATLDTAIAVAGLSPSDGDRARMHEQYGALTSSVDAMYAVPETTYEAPALVFQAAPKLTAWGS